MPDDRFLPAPPVRLTHPEWSKDAVVYQVNQRHFTPEGTFAAAQEHLPRLRDLGIDIVWLMPVNPIGEENRKGVLGSQYAVRDYLAVNPEFGTLDDLRAFVAAAHDLGMRVIVDWVPNHTAWDNPLTREHPEWYRKDFKGDFMPTPWWDWDDVIDLDYDQPGLRRYMTEAMAYWVREADIDGYRCDVAGYVPVDFWETARAELETIKPVFLLAEWENRDLHTAAFDATYAWSWNDTMHKIAHGRATPFDLKVYYAWNERAWPADVMRMMFVSNHDKNSWEGTEYEQFGPMLDAAVVLSVVSEGIPLIYNGQEAGNDRRLTFFDKDEIEWREDPQGELYRQLFALKKAHPALWNAAWGARMTRVVNDDETRVISFVRVHETRNAVVAAFNLSDSPARVRLGLAPGQDLSFVDAWSGEPLGYAEGSVWELPAWGYRVGVTPLD
ncbi:alpha-amylase family glycosyl hydrolase [Ornithinimicrobium sp. LYQ121]|uniref:alpha-amylase family glycosyl hydrolase n=1 Tax=Ornithinimicrobium sp. LYQ121 TaxID=3378801 RepID=UPI0038551C51